MSDQDRPQTENEKQSKDNEAHPSPADDDVIAPVEGDASRVVDEIKAPDRENENVEKESSTAADDETSLESAAPAEAEIVDTSPAPAAERQAASAPQPPPITSPHQAKAILESLLFSGIEPLSLQRLTGMMSPLSATEVRNLIVALQSEYDQHSGGLQLVEVAGGWQMATRPAFGEWVLQLQKGRRRPTLSPAALETLAIVAYKQPITRAEVEAVRGVDSSGIVRMLQDLELLKVVGRKEVPGRPGLYATTKKFLLTFGLNSLNDLPTISELREKTSVT